MTAVISEVALDGSLRRDGFVLLPPLPLGSLGEIREVFIWFAAHYAKGCANPFRELGSAHCAEVHACLAPLLAPIWSPLLNSYDALACGFVSQAPGAPEVPWHRQTRVTPGSQRPTLSLWLPLVDSRFSCGKLGLVPGSHLADGPPAVGPLLADDCRLIGLQPMDLPVQAGRPVLMHGALVRGAPPNRGGRHHPVATALLAATEAGADAWRVVESAGAEGNRPGPSRAGAATVFG